MKRLLFLILLVIGVASSTSNAQWTEIPQLPAILRWPMTAEFNGTFYVFGGVGTAASTAVYTYKPGDAAWTKLAVAMPKGKFAGYAAVANNKIYIVSGMTVSGTNYVTDNATLEFDPVAATFTAKKAIPTKTGFASCAAIGNKIYVVGGGSTPYTAGSGIALVQIYDPIADTWTNAASSAPFTTRHCGTAVFNGSIYVIAGLADDGSAATFSSQVWKGTPAANDVSWESKADLPQSVVEMSAGTVAGQIIATGGELTSGSPGYSSSYIYDPVADTWDNSYPLPMYEFNGGQLFGTGNDLYFAGGYQSQNAFKFTYSTAKTATAILSKAPIFVNLSSNQSRDLPLAAKNFGVVPLTVKITIPDSAKNWLSAAADLSIDPLGSDTYTFTLASGTLAAGLYKATATIVTNDPANAAIPINVSMYILPSSIKTQPTVAVLEEGTGNWCGYCPQGAEEAQSIKDNLGDSFIALEYHCGQSTPLSEPMAITPGANLIFDLGLQGFPNAAIQRWFFPGEAFQMTNRGIWGQYAQNVLDQQPDAPIAITVPTYTFNQTTKKVHAVVEFQRSFAMINDPNSSIRLTTIVTEDGLDGQQEDYRLPTPFWTDFHWNDIVRQIIPNELGTVVTIPSPNIIDGNVIAPGDKVDMTVDLTVPNTIKVDSLKNCNVTFIASVVTGSSTLGSILQAQRIPLIPAANAVEPNPTGAFSLSQNYPNPVSGETKIGYSLSERTSVSLNVYDVLGREVGHLVNAMQENGSYSVNFDASKLPAGSYIYVLNAGGKTIEKTMTVTK